MFSRLSPEAHGLSNLLPRTSATFVVCSPGPVLWAPRANKAEVLAPSHTVPAAKRDHVALFPPECLCPPDPCVEILSPDMMV